MQKLSVHVSPELLRRLAAEAWVGFKRVPRRGLEIGGVLLGHVERREEVTLFEIERFEPLESEHRTGPSYVLSEPDLERLDAILSRQRSSCLGIYRSHTRPEQPILQQADADLLDRYFRTHDGLFLVLIPAQGGAALFARSNGDLKCIHEFPLSSSIQPKNHPSAAPPLPLPAPEQPTSPPKDRSVELPMKPPEAISEPVREPAPASVPIPPRTPQPESRKIFGYEPQTVVWLIIGILVCLGLVVATSMLSPSVSRLAVRSAPLPQVVSLSVDQSGNLLTLRWNGNASVLQNAASGIVHIQDGDYQHDRHLDLRELRGGRLTYQARTQEVIFQLEVYGQQPSAIGYTHVTDLTRTTDNPKPGRDREQAQQEKPAPPHEKQEPVRTAAAVRLPAPQQNPATPPADAVANGVPKSSQAAPSQQPESPPAVIDPKPIDSAVAAAAPKPPAPKPPAPGGEANAAVAPAGPTSPPAHARGSITVSTEEVTPSLLGRFVERVPVLRRTRKRITTQPVPVYQPQPSSAVDDSQRIEQPVSIAVKLSVGETGAVRDAKVVDYGEPPNWGAANAALDAARRWTFKPARDEDGAVASEIMLRFRFEP